MPEYPYSCCSCGTKFAVYKRISAIDAVEACPDCGGDDTVRTIALVAIERSSAVQPYYEPALGTVIKSKSHKASILKARGLEEVGNSDPDRLHKDLDQAREKRMADAWDKV